MPSEYIQFKWCHSFKGTKLMRMFGNISYQTVTRVMDKAYTKISER